MKEHMTDYDAIIRAAQYRRHRAMGQFWRKLAETFSPRLPEILRHED